MSRNESKIHQIHTNPAAAAGNRGKGSAGKRTDVKAKVVELRASAKDVREEIKAAREERKRILAVAKEARAALRGHESELRKADAVLARLTKRNDSFKTKIKRLVA